MDAPPRARPRFPLLERAFLVGVGGLAVAIVAKTLIDLFTYYPYGVDVEIPLRAARRFADGGQPYLPEAFEVVAGPDLPFLYPPVTLPFLVPVLALPRALVLVVWTSFCLACGVFACRRLAIPGLAIPVVLAWAPFSEALLGGNVQVPLFAAFVAILFRGGGAPWRPRPRDVAEATSGRAAGDGLQATLIGAIKVSLAQPWLWVLRRRPAAALFGALVVIGLCVVTLPIVGLDRWFDWLGQAGRSGDPAWGAIGWPLSAYLGRPIGLVVTALSLVAVFFVPVRLAGAWIGLLAIVGAPSLHIFGLLFLLPAMLEIRREIALVAFLAIGTYTNPGLVLGTTLAAVAFVLSARVPMLRARDDAAVDVGAPPAARSAEPGDRRHDEPG